MLESFFDWLVYTLFGMPRGAYLSGTVHFFLYDSVKILLLLAAIVFAVSLLRSYVPQTKVRDFLVGKGAFAGNVLAALFGIVTPFCSCSAVPLFIGFIESGVPLGVTFSFLVSSPMVNEVALAMLWAMFGWKVALLYIGSGLAIAILSGNVIGRLHMERHVQEYVYAVRRTHGSFAEEVPSFAGRVAESRAYTAGLLRRIGLYVLAGVAIGAFIHGYAPEQFLAAYAGKDNVWAVPLVVLIGVPLYANAAGTIPIVSSLLEKGLPLGTSLAFMMSVTALSLPEMIILRQVLKPALLASFVAIVSAGILLTGYLFNAVL
jgi:uncharacterized membrane protein YraQ (UPF0718 family)